MRREVTRPGTARATTPDEGASPPGSQAGSHTVQPTRRRSLARGADVRRVAGTFAGVALVWLVFALSSPYFFTTDNILNILLQSANLFMVGAALTVVLI